MAITNLKKIGQRTYIGSGAPANGDPFATKVGLFRSSTVYFDKETATVYTRKAIAGTVNDFAVGGGEGGGGAIQFTDVQMTHDDIVNLITDEGAKASNILHLIGQPAEYDNLVAGNDFSPQFQADPGGSNGVIGIGATLADTKANIIA